MVVKQIWTGNAYRNFNYLIACEQTGEAVAVDPLDHAKCERYAREQGWRITHIVNTHEHHDHIGGNGPLVERTAARVLAHRGAAGKIPHVDAGLSAGDVIKIGSTCELEVLDTPGHTMSHVCLLARGATPALFCGDTLFNAGAGNCHNGGHPEALYQTFASQLAKLPDATLIYPGHDYIANNLRFTLDRETDNEKARRLLDDIAKQDPAQALVTTLGLEKEINTFFRLHSASVIARLRAAFPEMPEQPDAKTVFLKLRELRNKW